jgi:hypothetical protein
MNSDALSKLPFWQTAPMWLESRRAFIAASTFRDYGIYIKTLSRKALSPCCKRRIQRRSIKLEGIGKALCALSLLRPSLQHNIGEGDVVFSAGRLAERFVCYRMADGRSVEKGLSGAVS